MIHAPTHRASRVAVALLALAVAACPGGTDRDASGVPSRIVSLVPTATETLFALGAGDRVVARSAWCDYPAEAKRLPVAGDAVTANVERIALLDPDLVLVASGAQEEALAALAGRTRIESVLADTVLGVRREIRRLAELVGARQAGDGLLARIDGAISSARRRHEEGTAPSVLFAVQHDPLVVAGAGSYVGELLAVIGAKNVAADLDRAWPTLSLESFVARDPEVILDAGLAPGAAAGEGFWGRFSTVAAVRTGRIRAVDSEAVVRPGPRLPAALEELERLVYGEER